MPLPHISSLALLVFDFDGVLTDNRVLVSQDGTEFVTCSRSDGLAFDILREAGVPTIIMSTETNPVVSQRASKLKVAVLQAVADKGTELTSYCAEHGIPLNQVAFVGNDLNDLPAMAVAGCSIAPADSHQEVLKRAHVRLRTKGGHGVAREIVEEHLNLQSKYLRP
jgi:YrbI family 3-deoxy-D-manno-octulosonate 8-phosphate phosphatase